jgi:hypothetical protein
VAIAAGVRFGHYCILAPLGADGVGEVWLARDRRLNREVTIEVLPGSPEAAIYRFCARPGGKIAFSPRGLLFEMKMDKQRWQQIETLYHAALERTPDERAAFLADACADDSGLLREVEELLRHDGAAESFMQDNALAVAAQALEPNALSQTAPQLFPLEKRPERRFQSASDLGFALEALSLPGSSGANRTEMAPGQDASAWSKRSGWRERLAWIVAGALALALLAFGVAYFLKNYIPLERYEKDKCVV